MSAYVDLENWLNALSELRWAEVLIGEQKRWCVRLFELDLMGAELPVGEAEGDTLEGAIEQVMSQEKHVHT